MIESIRLSKRLAEQLACSRAEAEQYIQGGWVRVDGEVIEEPGARVSAQQQLELLPDAKLEAVVPLTLLLHKTAGMDVDAALATISADNLMADDRSGNRFLKRHLHNLSITDRLDSNASGLLVLSQDWHVARKLVDDAARVEHEYVVEVNGHLSVEGLALLNHGLSFNNRPLPPCKVSWQNETRLRFALKGAVPGQVAVMCEKVGLTVVSIKRLRIGRIPLAGLPLGQWRYLLGYERF